MPDVVFKVDAETAPAVTAMLKIVEAQKKAEDGMRNLSAASRETATELSSMASGADSFKDGMGAAFEGIKGGVGAVTAAFGALAEAGNQMLDRFKEKTKNFSEELEQLKNSLGQTGDISMLPEVEARLDELASKTSNLSKKQLGQIAAEVQKEGKGQLSPEDIITATGEAAMAAQAGKDPHVFAKTFAQLSRLGVGTSTEEKSDAVTQLLRASPEGLGEGQLKFLSRAVSGGADPASALRLITAASRGDEGPKDLNKLLDQSTKNVDLAAINEKRGLESQRGSLEAQIEEIANRSAGLGTDDDLRGRSGSLKERKHSAEQEKKTLQAQEKLLKQQHKDVSSHLSGMHGVKDVSDMELDRLTRLQALPEGQRFGAMLQDETLLDDEGKGSLKNLRANLDAGEFSAGGAFGSDLAKEAGMRNADTAFGRKLRLLHRKKQVAVSGENRMSEVSERGLAATLEADELDEAVEKKGGITRALYNANIGGIGVKSLSHGMIGAGEIMHDAAAPGGGSSSKESQAVLQDIRDNTRRGRNEGARNGAFNQ